MLPPISLTTTFAPFAASSSAYSRPRPRPAPVMTATRPSNLRSVTTSLLYEPLIIWFPPPTHGGEHSTTPFMPSAANGGVSRHTRPSDIQSSAPLTAAPPTHSCPIHRGGRAGCV